MVVEEASRDSPGLLVHDSISRDTQHCLRASQAILNLHTLLLRQSSKCRRRVTPSLDTRPKPKTQTNISGADLTDRYAAGLRLNKEWAAQTARDHPQLFPTLASGQKPQILWIGCSDSRCPETTFLGLEPGDVFVHRNIANVLHPGDLSSSVVIEYAVQYLRVNHVVVCGHTACGGISAAMGNKNLGILDPWLFPLRQLRERNLKLLQSMPAGEAASRLAELNVREGLNLVKQKSVVLNAIRERGLQVHGLIYDVGSGVLSELDTEDSEEVIRARLTAFQTE
ncbi:Carbonic anhydrase [Penicillium robsamsonii]|uniref:Carbonic anhydrase n=1 Tax=Penicillium robsamsonii TaxID=1792511 RepID=UPI0025478CAC|nr:Carbonic anhydrase [Penicillium robsamsonii]KAJ5823226.1 Carbonic anhydrase [Penicillium robsamsonii]